MSATPDATADHYRILGVSKDATGDQIKKSYRRLAKKYHPDSTGGDKAKEARFKDVSNAYDVLGDEQKRAQYDAIRASPQFPPGFGGFGGASGDRHAGFGGGGFSPNLGDLFSQMFSGGAPGGPNVRYTYTNAGEPRGRDPRDPRGARGRRPRPAAQRPQAPRRRTVRANDGSTLEQLGLDLHSDVRVTIDQAILGCVTPVPTLSGTAKVKIPPGTSSGAKLRLKEKGAPGPGGKRGNHYVTVQIDVPKDIDAKSKKLLAEFMKRTRKRS